MTFSELDTKLGDRQRLRERTILYYRGGPHSITVARVYRASLYPVAEVTRQGRIIFRDRDGRLAPTQFVDTVNALMPPNTYKLAEPVGNMYIRKNVKPRWQRAQRSEPWPDTMNKVQVPFTGGDSFDVDANYLHAARRNDF